MKFEIIRITYHIDKPLVYVNRANVVRTYHLNDRRHINKLRRIVAGKWAYYSTPSTVTYYPID